MEKIKAPVETPMFMDNGVLDQNWWIYFTSLGSSNPEFESVILENLTPLRIVSSDSNKKIVSVNDLTEWINGVNSEIEVIDNGDGTITIGLPDNVVITGTLEVGDNLHIMGSIEVDNDADISGDVVVSGSISSMNRDLIRYSILQG